MKMLLRLFCGISRIHWMRRCTTVAMALFICYIVRFYFETRLQLEPSFLNPTLAPNSYSSLQIQKLAGLSHQYSDLILSPSGGGGDAAAVVAMFSGLRYEEVLQKLASPGNKQIVLALIDGGFLSIAVNFYMSCLKPFDIDNYLFLATDQSACDALAGGGIHCFMFRADNASDEASVYHSASFLRKMNIRTAMILRALNAGFQVLHSDVDITCQRNMLLHQGCPTCDVSALYDFAAYNAGFLHVRPSAAGIAVYAEMQRMVDEGTELDDQAQLNKALSTVQATRWDFKLEALGDGFQCGKVYYQDAGRYFATDAAPCPECVVVHNNWIVTMEAKVYRAKEMHQWMYDRRGYYTSTARRYLAYDNPLQGRGVAAAERDALVSALALGRILNRTVILPKFHCGFVGREHCSMISLFRIDSFDREFGFGMEVTKAAPSHASGPSYREHTFLAHPLVPAAVRDSVYGPVLVRTRFLVETAGPDLDLVARQHEVIPDNSQTKTTNRITIAFSESEVQRRFGHVTEPVLRFVALYGAFDRFDSPAVDAEFRSKVSAALVDSTYLQFVN